MKCSVPRSPADSIDRSPAPSIRSKIRWLKNTVLIRSSGISMPCFDSHAAPGDHPVGGEHEIVVTQFAYR